MKLITKILEYKNRTKDIHNKIYNAIIHGEASKMSDLYKNIINSEIVTNNNQNIMELDNFEDVPIVSFKEYLALQIHAIDVDKWNEGVRLNKDPGEEYVMKWFMDNAAEFAKKYRVKYEDGYIRYPDGSIRDVNGNIIKD